MRKASTFLLVLALVVVLSGMGMLSGCGEEAKEPTVTTVNPATGRQGETLDVTITGTNLSEATAVSFGAGITVSSFMAGSDTQISASIAIAASAAQGARSVTVTTPDGTDAKTAAFTVTSPEAPSVSGISPDSGEQAESLDVTITGSNFINVNDVSLGAGVTVDSYNVDSATQISASITIAPNALEAPRDVSVTNPSGTGTGGIFTVTWPAALDELIDAAVAEGELDLQFAMPEALVQALQDGINEKYGLDVTFHYAPSYNMPAQASRLIDQFNAGVAAETDLYLGSESHLPQMNRIGAIKAYDWKELFPYIPDGAIQLDSTSLEYDSFFQGISYNTDLVAEEEVPRFAQDILDPKWQGLVASTPYAAGFTRMADESLFGYEGTKAFLEDLTDQIGGLIGCGELERLATGEFYILILDCGPGEAEVHAGTGQPVAHTVLEDVAILGHVYETVPTHAEHPNLSALLAGYLMSQEGQQLLNEYWHRGSHHVEGTPQYEEYHSFIDRGITVADLNADTMNEREDEVNAWQYEFIQILTGAA